MTDAEHFSVRFNKDPMSALLSFVGFLGGVVALLFLYFNSTHDGVKAAAMAFYGVSLAALFLASTLYHFFDLGERGNRWLRRMDHSAIFMLIAGTYTPPLIHCLSGSWRLVMLSIIAFMAVGGTTLKLFWIECPNWLSTGLYLLMGWVFVVPAFQIVPQITTAALLWVIAGGLSYTVGAVIEFAEWPNPRPSSFGFHEVWHLFVLAGAGSHFFFIASLVDFPRPSF